MKTGTDICGNRLFGAKLKLNFSIAWSKKGVKLEIIKKLPALVKILLKLTDVSLLGFD